ncbi:guanine nucleotide-binding protein G(I)/G(S)/G(O) subunit gamma-7 isoform X1 [Pelodiscus sinensis]|uniref:guanine nucleotide-binding protein G(I)/G(S)/G(O) subunit gamma-7 isoform X1 n=1 Tax=Pelodiscus sinensis TaxID=13735 RepID=UPI003F6B885E
MSDLSLCVHLTGLIICGFGPISVFNCCSCLEELSRNSEKDFTKSQSQMMTQHLFFKHLRSRFDTTRRRYQRELSNDRHSSRPKAEESEMPAKI